MISNLFFVFPQAVYLLLFIVLAAAFYYFLVQDRNNKTDRFAAHALKRGMILPRNQKQEWMKWLVFVAAWSLAVIALMQPASYGQSVRSDYTLSTKPAKNFIIMLDASASMLVQDSADGNSRFKYGKEIAEELLSRLKGHNIALYAFTSEVIPLAPLTADYLYLHLVMDKVNINPEGIPGTDFATTLNQLNKDYQTLPIDHPILILLSDGEDTQIESLQGQEKAQAIQKILNELKGWQVNTIGLGSTTPRPIPNLIFENKPVESLLREDLLKQMSQVTSGTYYEANRYMPLKLADEIVARLNRHEELSSTRSVMTISDFSYVSYFQIPLMLSIILLLGIKKWSF